MGCGASAGAAGAMSNTDFKTAAMRGDAVSDRHSPPSPVAWADGSFGETSTETWARIAEVQNGVKQATQQRLADMGLGKSAIQGALAEGQLPALEVRLHRAETWQNSLQVGNISSVRGWQYVQVVWLCPC